MEIYLKKASMNDCKQILQMQIESFQELLETYKDYNTNPAADSIINIERRMAQDYTDYYFICLNGIQIGVIRIVRLSAKSCRISPMFILPNYQGRGYAQQAIAKIESYYSKTKFWELDTIKQESRLCHLYEKMGYKPTGKEVIIQDGMTIVHYEKQVF